MKLGKQLFTEELQGKQVTETKIGNSPLNEFPDLDNNLRNNLMFI